MPYCASCAVEVEENRQVCPLCQGVLQEELPHVAGRFPLDQAEEEFVHTVPWQLIRAWVMGGVALATFITCLVVSLVDWIRGSGLQWSPYAMAPVLAGGLMIRIVLYEWGRPVRLIGQVLVVAGFLVVLLDFLDGRLSWSMAMALPILGMTALCFWGWFAAVNRRRMPCEMAAAGWFAAVMVFCLLLDGWISVQESEGPALGWSVPVVVTLAPWLVIVPYIGRRLRQDPQWRRFFHV